MMRTTYEPTQEDREDMLAFWPAYQRYREHVSLETIEAAKAIPEFAAVLSAMTPEQQKQQDEHSSELQRAAIVDGHWGPYLDDLSEQGARYARMGIPFRSWFELVRAYRRSLLRLIVRHYEGDQDRAMAAVAGMDRFVDLAMSVIGDSYLDTKEKIIADQNEAIREISTPVLQVRERMLILPIIGMVDTHRARHLTQCMLENISRRRARVVVMDITGVPIVDSKVANHFIQAVEAAKLMGATVIITGVSSQIAQTLVTIGASLGDITTLCDLQEGIEEGERLLRLRPPAEDSVPARPLEA